MIQVNPGKPGAEFNRKTAYRSKEKLAEKNVATLRPCFIHMTTSIVVPNISICPSCSWTKPVYS